MMKKLLITSMVALTIGLNGCASIITGSSQTLTFTSVPESATIEIKNRNGVKVHTGQTPATVSLKKVPVILNQKVIKYLSVNLVIKLKR